MVPYHLPSESSPNLCFRYLFAWLEKPQQMFLPEVKYGFEHNN
jgi:hypothetical protein